MINIALLISAFLHAKSFMSELSKTSKKEVVEQKLIAKSANAGLAYEWDNYRLACSTMNSRKRDYNDVLDPFLLAPDLFRLQLSTGHIYANPTLDAAPMRIVEETIERLGLDDPQCREMRARWYQDYLEHQLPADYLKNKAPFIWVEANRQGLL